MRFFPALLVVTFALRLTQVTVTAAEPQKEMLDTAKAAAPAAAPAPAASDSAKASASTSASPAASTPATAPAASAPAPSAASSVNPEPITVESQNVSKLQLGGVMLLKGLYHNFLSDQDADKRLSLTMRKFRVDLDGAFDPHFGFRGQFLLEANGRNLGVDDAYLYYAHDELMGVKAGKLKRPFSQEALASSKTLYTIERGELYHNFLANTTGYAYYDLGVVGYGGFSEEDVGVTYEVGIFNGKQNNDPSKDYSGQQYETTDKGFLAKDFVGRLTISPFKLLKLEAAVSTKAAEDTTDPASFDYNVNTAYELGLDFVYSHLRLLGEAAWGDNHQNVDAKIISGSTMFFGFYGTAVWREDYSRGRASELLLKLEGLDPSFKPGKGEGTPNDGKLRYTVGCNYFLTPRVTLMADYGILQPISKAVGTRSRTHDFDLAWRMSY